MTSRESPALERSRVISRLDALYRRTGANLPYSDPRPSHGAQMEGYFWRVTDVESSRVIFHDAEIYAEKNWGAGFPERWWWGQAQGFEHPDVCVAFGGGRLTAGPLAITVGGVVVRVGDDVTALRRRSRPCTARPMAPAGRFGRAGMGASFTSWAWELASRTYCRCRSPTNAVMSTPTSSSLPRTSRWK
jgi:hypothetical protein